MKRTELKRTTPLRAKPAKEPKRRTRKCSVKTCRAPFEPKSMLHKACSPSCAEILVSQDKVAKLRKERQEGLIALKPAKWWKAKAKKAMHAYVRARDEGKPCVSCDTILLRLGRAGGDYDAGHFRSVGSAKHLEFDERNVFGQCKHCNDHLKGNQLEYERRLRLLKGDAYVDELKADQMPRHHKIADFQAIEDCYKRKLRELQKGKA